MKFNQWTLGLAAVGAVSLASVVRADEAKLSALQTALSNTTISGFVDVAAQFNMGNQSPYSILPSYANYDNHNIRDGFNLNALNIAIDKPLDESKWASGYHVEINTGNNAIQGMETYQSGSWGGVTVRQAYVALRTPVGNGIDWKIGVFDGVTGYEANSGYQNPNYTYSYGYGLNPATETGIIGSYKVCNEVTVQMGLANRNMAYNNSATPLSSKDYIATVALTAPDSWGFLKGSVLNLGTVQAFDNYGVNNYSINGTFNTPVAGLKVGLAYDKVQSLISEGADGNVYGVYATYQATDKLSLNVRGEYVDGQNLNVFSGNGKGEEVTVTVAYNLWANVITRAEFRWDHTETGGQYSNNENNENALLLAFNVIYKF